MRPVNTRQIIDALVTVLLLSSEIQPIFKEYILACRLNPSQRIAALLTETGGDKMGLKAMKIRTRLWVGFGLVILLFILSTVITSLLLIKADRSAAMVKDKNMPYALLAKDVAFQVVQVQQFLTDVSATHDTSVYAEAEEAAKVFKEDIEKFRTLYRSENDTESLSKIDALDSAFNTYYETGKKMANAYVTKGIQEGNILMDEFDKTTKTMTAKVKEFEKSQVDEALAMSNNVGHAIAQVKTILYGLSLLAIVLGAFIALYVTSTIIRPLNMAVDISNSISKGDLTVQIEIDSRDETGQMLSAMKNMAGALKGLITNIKSTSDNMATASQQLSSRSAEMSRGVTEQSDRSSQIATAADQMSRTVSEIASNTTTIATSANEAAKVAKNGEKIVDKSIAEVGEIAETVNESARLIMTLGDRSKEIGDIVNVINEIAEQTNLLALNAAIEAARAGDQGKGFAVVADEVRKLAERTAKATSEIGTMIGSIRNEIEKTVSSMKDVAKRVGTGVEFTAQAGEALRDIVKSVDQLQSMVQQIASATEEMSTTSEQISSDILTIANVSKETSSGSSQIAQASSELARLATDLTSIGGQFRI